MLQKSVYRGTDGTRVKYFAEDIEDLKRLIDIPYVPLAPDVSAYAREKEELGEQGLMMVDVGDPLGVFYHMLSAGGLFDLFVDRVRDAARTVGRGV